MDIPTTGEEGSLRNGDRPGPTKDVIKQKVIADGGIDDGAHDGENKFQRAISVWRGTASFGHGHKIY